MTTPLADQSGLTPDQSSLAADQSALAPDLGQPGVRAARVLLRRTPVFDGHNDLAWELREAVTSGKVSPPAADPAEVDISAPVPYTHTDLPRLAAGGVGAQFWSVYVPAELDGDSAVTATLEQVDLVRRLIARNPDRLELAGTADDVERISESGKVASLLGAEGGHSINGSLGVLRALYDLGVRYLTLTHNRNTPWADSATDTAAHGGLTEFGRSVVREMQRIGMLVDLSHVAPQTMSDALDEARAPVIFSHSSARALCDHPRNVPDEILARLAANNGVCMVTFVPVFVSAASRAWAEQATDEAKRRGLDWRRPRTWDQMNDWTAANPQPKATLSEVADHVEHVARVAGIDHVGLGGDFDGTTHLPEGLHDVSCYPALIAELLERGWTESDCGGLASGNIMRVLREAEASAAGL